jgi:hypothetical protein
MGNVFLICDVTKSLDLENGLEAGKISENNR